jgi:hypothetical protein
VGRLSGTLDLEGALREQYGAGLAMLRQAVERCPEDVWTSGVHPRTFWRIAYHAAFYTHLYLGRTEEDFRPWSKHRDCASLWEDPPEEAPFSRSEMLEYVDEIQARLGELIQALDLEAESTGFSWYPNMTKLSHQILNVRHLQGHVGQLSEILMARGLDVDWVSKARP